MDQRSDSVKEKQRRLDGERRERLRAERIDRRKILGCWMAFSSDAFQAMNDMDRADRKLGAKSFMALILMLCATVANGQPVLVLTDTNLAKLLPAGAVRPGTNLYLAQIETFVTTNWIPVGRPIDITNKVGVVIGRRQYETFVIITNVAHKIELDGVERRWTLPPSFGQQFDTRSYELPTELPQNPFLNVPLRQPR